MKLLYILEDSINCYMVKKCTVFLMGLKNLVKLAGRDYINKVSVEGRGGFTKSFFNSLLSKI